MEISNNSTKEEKKELTFVYKFEKNGESFNEIMNRIILNKLMHDS